VFYYVFDVLYADGRDTRPLPLRERKALQGRGQLRRPDPVQGGRDRDWLKFKCPPTSCAKCPHDQRV
jgi:ATP-dependent DNA ligase